MVSDVSLVAHYLHALVRLLKLWLSEVVIIVGLDRLQGLKHVGDFNLGRSDWHCNHFLILVLVHTGVSYRLGSVRVLVAVGASLIVVVDDCYSCLRHLCWHASCVRRVEVRVGASSRGKLYGVGHLRGWLKLEGRMPGLRSWYVAASVQLSTEWHQWVDRRLAAVLRGIQ